MLRHPTGHIPRLRDFPARDRRRLIEGLKSRARLCAAEKPGTVAIAVHGRLAAESTALTDFAELLIVVEQPVGQKARPGGDDAAGAFDHYFADLPLDIQVAVLSRQDFRDRMTRGDPGLAAVRDQAVLLCGTLPIAEIWSW